MCIVLVGNDILTHFVSVHCFIVSTVFSTHTSFVVTRNLCIHPQYGISICTHRQWSMGAIRVLQKAASIDRRACPRSQAACFCITVVALNFIGVTYTCKWLRYYSKKTFDVLIYFRILDKSSHTNSCFLCETFFLSYFSVFFSFTTIIHSLFINFS